MYEGGEAACRGWRVFSAVCGLRGTVEVTLQIPKRLATLRHCLLFYRGFSTFVLSRKCEARPLWMPLLLCTGRLAVDTAHRPRAGLSVCASVAALFFPLVLAPHMHRAAPQDTEREGGGGRGVKQIVIYLITRYNDVICSRLSTHLLNGPLR